VSELPMNKLSINEMSVNELSVNELSANKLSVSELSVSELSVSNLLRHLFSKSCLEICVDHRECYITVIRVEPQPDFFYIPNGCNLNTIVLCFLTVTNCT